MNTFVINGIMWKIKYVPYGSEYLTRSDGSYTVGMTNWNDTTIYLANGLQGGFLERVLCHELCHCFCFSYDIHINLNQEEFLADWIAVYGRNVIDLLDELLYSATSKNVMKCHESS